MAIGSADAPPWLIVLRALATGDWVSGEVLAGHLGVTRSAVWKQVAALEERGLAVARSPGRGYRLERPVALLDRDRLQQALAAAGFAGTCVVLPEVASTNGWLREQAAAGSPVVACLAEDQRAGRGRRGRAWAAAPARNIALSVVWRFAAGPAGLAGLSLAIGVAAAEALEPFGVSVKLKWPNDLLLGGSKIGGILIELEGEFGGAATVIVGLGLNLDQPPDSRIDQRFTDLARALGVLPPRNAIACVLVTACLETCRRFEAKGLAPFLPRWIARDCFRGERVRVEGPTEALIGRACGVDDRGALLVKVDGQMHAVQAGEISLRGEGPSA